MHSFIDLELLIRHIPNILNTFKGLPSSGRTNSSRSLRHHWSFLRRGCSIQWHREKSLAFTSLDTLTQRDPTPKITGTAKPITFISPVTTKYCKSWEEALPFISKGRKRALTHQSIASNINQVFNCRKISQCFSLPKCALYQFPFPKGHLLMKSLKWYF